MLEIRYKVRLKTHMPRVCELITQPVSQSARACELFIAQDVIRGARRVHSLKLSDGLGRSRLKPFHLPGCDKDASNAVNNAVNNAASDAVGKAVGDAVGDGVDGIMGNAISHAYA